VELTPSVAPLNAARTAQRAIPTKCEIVSRKFLDNSFDASLFVH
jgi:hypothetical protein